MSRILAARTVRERDEDAVEIVFVEAAAGYGGFVTCNLIGYL